MISRDADERSMSPETSISQEAGETCPPPRAQRASWPNRILARIKQGERFQACAYFLSTIL